MITRFLQTAKNITERWVQGLLGNSQRLGSHVWTVIGWPCPALLCLHFQRLVPERIEALSCFVPLKMLPLTCQSLFQYQPGVQGLWNKSLPVRRINLPSFTGEENMMAQNCIYCDSQPDLIIYLITKNQNEHQNIKRIFSSISKAYRVLKPPPGVVLCECYFYLVEALPLLKVKTNSCRREKTQLSTSYLLLWKSSLFYGGGHKHYMIWRDSSAAKLTGVTAPSVPFLALDRHKITHLHWCKHL